MTSEPVFTLVDSNDDDDVSVTILPYPPTMFRDLLCLSRLDLTKVWGPTRANLSSTLVELHHGVTRGQDLSGNIVPAGLDTSARES